MCSLWHIVVGNDNAPRKAQNVLQRLCYGIHKITNMSYLRPQGLELLGLIVSIPDLCTITYFWMKH